ncbi:hypothetical protein CASFOL_032364 [Castilleja foliolosa]|uniref:Uncharacterized protein n=1 Tax=Castilleja foliolosa TaxID=1961234 RepID=A0ABD3C192_9LAMI
MPFDRQSSQSFRQKNAKVLTDESDVARQEYYYRDADKYCKAILGRLSSGHGFLKATAFTIVVLAVGAAVVSRIFMRLIGITYLYPAAIIRRRNLRPINL